MKSDLKKCKTHRTTAAILMLAKNNHDDAGGLETLLVACTNLGLLY